MIIRMPHASNRRNRHLSELGFTEHDTILMLKLYKPTLYSNVRRFAALGRVRPVPHPKMAAATPIPNGLPATTGLSLELWQSVQYEVFLSLHDPFVQGLAQGTLDRRSFQHYVAQDAHFLTVFARAYGLALSKALALDDDTFSALSRLLRGVHRELQLHGAYAAAWGVDLALLGRHGPGGEGAGADGAGKEGAGAEGAGKEGAGAASVVGAGPSAATRAYTDFLLEVAEAGGQDGDVLEILAAMLPCSRLYGFLGCRLAEAHGGAAGAAGAGAAEAGSGGDAGGPSHHHEYWEWVKTYSSPEYLAIPALKEAIFDRLAARADKAKLLSLYRRAMRLEAGFFAAQPHCPPPRRISALVVDFDETCTPRDTTAGLMQLARAAAEKGRPTPGDPSWAAATPDRLAAGYVEQQAALLREILPEGHPDSPSYDPAGLSTFLERLSDFDERMNVVVEDSGILRGSTAGEVAAAGTGVALRPHCREALRGVLRRDIPVTVMSVNWSDVYVGAALGLPTRTPTATEAAGGDSTSPAIQLRCNSLQVGPDGLTTGHLVKRVQTARDKAAAMQRIKEGLRQRQQQQQQEEAAASANCCGGGDGGAAAAATADSSTSSSSSSNSSTPGFLVYVGDSTSDMGALLAADGGIVVGNNKLLRRVAARYGVQLRPLAAAPLDPRVAAAATAGGTLYEAAGWEEVRAWLLGLEEEGEEKQTAVAAEAAVVGEWAVASVAARPAGSPPGKVLPRVLSIAGSDSGGGAGVQADIKAMLSRGVFAMTAVTALTAQNTHGVSAVHVVPPEFLAQQIDAVLSDLGADAVKTGMLPTPETVEVVAERLTHHLRTTTTTRQPATTPTSTTTNGTNQDGTAAGVTSPSSASPLPPQAVVPPLPLSVPLVVDPVLVSTSGHSLAEGGVAGALRTWLLPLAALVTPNIPEAEALLGCGPITSVQDMRRAARDLQVLTGCGAVLVKGGHLKPPTDDGGAVPHEVVDVLYDGQQLHELRGPWIHTENTHGTGCTLASAIAAELSKGLPLLPAVTAARAALGEALRASAPLAIGSGVQRPFHHLHMLDGGVMTGRMQGKVGGGSSMVISRVDPATLRRQLRLYAVTDPHCNKKCNRTLLEAVTQAVRGGATIVQLREKDIDGGDFAREAAQALRVCRQYGVPLIINDRVDVALAIGADGVHVGQSDLPAEVVRAMIGPGRILGVSVKTPDQARAAAASGADYLGAGAVLPTGTKDTGVIGLGGLAAVAVAAAPLPVVAIGGVSAAHAADTVRAGCAGIAVVSAIFAAEDAEGAARALRAAVDAALQH